jgi:predicted DNA-binding transcriptional regulator AlpA
MKPQFADVDALLAEPARAAGVPSRDVPALLDALAVQEGRARVVRELLTARLSPNGATTSADDHMLSIDEAVARLGMSRAWLYRHHGTLPFARKIGRKIVFSEAGLTRWLAKQRG